MEEKETVWGQRAGCPKAMVSCTAVRQLKFLRARQIY